MKVKFDNLTFKMSADVTGTIDNMSLDGEVDELVKFIDLLLEAEVLNPELNYDHEIKSAYDISEDFEICETEEEPESSPEEPESSSEEDILETIIKLMPAGYFKETGFREYKWEGENAKIEVEDDGERIKIGVYAGPSHSSHLAMYIRPRGIHMCGATNKTFCAFMDYIKDYIPKEIDFFIRNVYHIFSK